MIWIMMTILKWEQLRLAGENPAKTMGEAKSYQAYLADPTEMHARIMQLREEFEMSPNKTITPQFSKKIIDFVNKHIDYNWLNEK